MDMIKFPVKFDRTGFQKHTDGTEGYYTQLLSIALLTEPRTHIFTPRFGVFDPTFRGIDRGVFVMNAARFIPEIEITGLDTEVDPNSGSLKVNFSFRIKSEA